MLRRLTGFWVGFLLLATAYVQAARAAPTPPTLILVSIDAYRADYIERARSPVLAAMAAEGVHVKALRPVFPSLTYPNHYTMVTGLYPDHHGVINNSMHDPLLGDFTPGDRAATADRRWWDEAEPIWVTAQNQGRRTASVFWPGTQAQIHGVLPTYWKPFDPTLAPDARVDQALQWLDLPPSERPSFVSLYFEQVDVAGHNHGPDSTEVDAALTTIDAALGHLVDELRKRNQYDSTNLVIVSDHGMAPTSPERIVLLDQLVDLQHVELVSSLVNIGINPRPGYTAEVERALLRRHPHLQCWRKGAMPRTYHYGHNGRIPAIQCVTEVGWMASTAAVEAKRAHPLLGEHGYDNFGPQMQALFVAHGPAFKQHFELAELDNLNVYALLAKLMAVKPLANDGHPRAIAPLLRAFRRS